MYTLLYTLLYRRLPPHVHPPPSAPLTSLGPCPPPQGLANFRLVVQQIGSRQYKYICCMGGCPNPPSTAPSPKTEVSASDTARCVGAAFDLPLCRSAPPPLSHLAAAPIKQGGFVEMLIDIVADPYDMHDLAPANRDIAAKMQKLLPHEYAAGCAAAY